MCVNNLPDHYYITQRYVTHATLGVCGGGHNAVLMWTSPMSEAYASHAQAPASSCESEKEGSLCEVEAPPY